MYNHDYMVNCKKLSYIYYSYHKRYWMSQQAMFDCW